MRRLLSFVGAVALLLVSADFPAGIAAAQETAALPVEIVPPALHTQGVNSVVFSNDDDDRLAASSGDDGVIKLWDVKTGRLIRNVARVDPNNKYWRVKSLSSDGRRLIAYVGGDYKVWDTLTGKEILSLPNPDDSGDEDAVFMSHDGSRVALRSAKTVKLFDARTGKQLATLANTINIAFSEDGRRIVAGSTDKKIEILDSDGKFLRSLTTVDEEVKSLTYSPDGRRIAIRTNSDVFKLWDPESNRLVAERRGNADAEGLFSPDGRYWAFRDGKDAVEILKTETGETYSTFKQPADKVSIVDFSHDSRLIFFTPDSSRKTQAEEVLFVVNAFTGQIVSTIKGSPDATYFGSRYAIEGDDNGTLRLRDLETGQEVRTFLGQPSLGAGVFSATGSRMTVSVSGKVSVLNPETGRRIGTCPASGEIHALAFSPDGRRLLYDGEDKTIVLCDLESGKVIRSFADHEVSVKAVAFSADARQILSGDEDGTVKLWDVATGKVLRTFKGNQRSVDVVRFTPDGRKLLAGTNDNKVRIWDVATGRELKTLRMLVGPVNAMTVSPDGRRVAAGPYSDLMVKQWDIESGKELRRLQSGYSGRFVSVTDVKYSTAGDRVLAAISNNYLVVWDTETGRKLIEVSQRDQDFKAVSFSNDGRRLLSLDEAGVVRHWDKKTGALLLTVIPFGDDEWLRVTPEGFFDASPNGAKYLTVVRGLDVYSIDQFYDRLYRPDLVGEKLAGDPRGKVKDAAAKLDLTKLISSGAAPKVTVALARPATTTRESEAAVEAAITDEGGGIGKIEWRVNGVTLGVDTRGLVRTDRPGAPASKTINVSQTLSLDVGENVIEVVVYNAQGMIASLPAVLKVVREGAQLGVKPRLHVVAVGVNDYWDSRLHLKYAVPDAKSLGEALRQAGESLYESVEITTVLDAEVTIAKLDRLFSDVGRKVRSQDVFVFFLAGHGKTVDGRYYFLPQDFRYDGEESIVTRGVGQDRWQEWFARIPARKSILLYDTCESGSLTGDRIAERGLERVAALDRMTRAMGRTVLTASTDDTPALEGYRGHGVFTYALLDALGRADGNGDGLVDVTEIAGYIDQQVPELSVRAFKKRQVPQMKIVGSNFPLAHRKAVLSGGEVSAPDIPTKPTHVVITPAEVYAKADATGAVLQKLAPGTLVTLVKTEQGWVLVAREGKPLGYVAANGIAPMQ